MIGNLDKAREMSHNRHPLHLTCAVLCILGFVAFSGITEAAAAGNGLVDLGITMPKEASAIAGSPHRFRVQAGFQKTLWHFENYFSRAGKVRIYPAVIHHSVVAWHVANTDDSRPWTGINITSIRGKVEIQVIEREAPPKS